MIKVQIQYQQRYKLNQKGINMDPLSSQFKTTHQFQLTNQYNNLIDKIKKIRQIVDPRNNHQLKYYQSKLYQFKLLGLVNHKRPIGQCLFYFDHQFIYQPSVNPNNKKKKPVIITTKISPNYLFANNTLIIYDDSSYYIGEIQAKRYQIPRATGKGLLVTPDFIYEGQFEQGFPEGFGRYRTKYLQFTGSLRKGIPYGECIQKTSKGLFTGRVNDTNKIGYLITPENKRVEINEKIHGLEIDI